MECIDRTVASRFSLIALIFLTTMDSSLSPAIAAQTSESWTCSTIEEFEDGSVKTIDLKIVYEIRGKKLFGYEDDYSGKPNVYDILENSGDGFIAIRYTKGQLISVVFDKRKLRMRHLSQFASSNYEDRWLQTCLKNSK